MVQYNKCTVQKLKFTCRCGQKIIVPDSLVGETLICPNCAKPIEAPPDAQKVRPDAYADVKRFTINCVCGQKLILKLEAIGAELFCPNCKRKLKVRSPRLRRGETSTRADIPEDNGAKPDMGIKDT